MRIKSSKTEHHEGGDSRIVPIQPKLREQLFRLQPSKAVPSGYVITRYRQPSCNLRTQFERYLKATGIQPWPGLFHNLRASCETEWIDQYGIDTACRWIGNSPEVAARHYAVTADRDANLKKAAGLDTPNDPKNAAQKAPEIPGNAE